MIITRIGRLEIKSSAKSEVSLEDYERSQAFIKKENLNKTFKAAISETIEDAVDLHKDEIVSYPSLLKIREHLHFTIHHEQVVDNKFWLHLSGLSSTWHEV